MAERLQDKVALVTGGNGSLGQGVVKALMAQGAKVAFCGRDEAKNQKALQEFQRLHGEAFAVQCDVSKSSEVKEMYDKILRHYGTVDILVNNAAVTEGGGRHHENGLTDRENYIRLTSTPGAKFSLAITQNLTDEEWTESIQVNLNSVFYCTREALKIMALKKSGKIINIVSMAGVTNRSPHSPAYAAAKGGVVAFTKNLAMEVAGDGIIVNAVAPSFINTPAFKSFAAHCGEEMIDRMLLNCPSKRLGTIEENASLVAYLAGDEANYIVGQVINVNGGLF